VTRYQENNGHRWARLYRRVRAATMVDPTLAAEYDPDRNIVFINSEVFEQLTPEQQKSSPTTSPQPREVTHENE
jgi:hypothetical protein